jgi:hypothetical protein
MRHTVSFLHFPRHENKIVTSGRESRDQGSLEIVLLLLLLLVLLQ